MLENNKTQLKPPKVMQTFVQGFNLVAAHPYLMAFSLFLDFFFWFGPFYRIKNLLSPALDEMMATLSNSITTSDVASLLKSTKETWELMLDNFNLLITLRTYPIGIPSLLASKGYVANPLSSRAIFEVPSSSQAMLILLACFLGGIFLTGLYYSLISDLVQNNKIFGKDSRLFYRIGQTFLFFFLIILAATLLTFPILCFLSSLTAFMPTANTIPFLILGIVLLWIIMPFIFSAHGIFAKHINAFQSISLSTKFVRLSSPATTLFLTIAIALSYGLDLLWSTPSSASWLYALGLIGHAFVSSGILCASFVYYRDGTLWMEEMLRVAQQNAPKTQI